MDPLELSAVPGPPYVTGGPPYPAYPTDEGKYGLSILDWFAGHCASGLMANTELITKQFVADIPPPAPAEQEVPLQSVASTVVSMEYTFDTKTAEPVQASNAQVNNADQTLATKLWVGNTTSTAVDVSNVLRAIGVNHEVYLQDKDDSTKSQHYDVTGPSIDKGNYFELPITFMSGGAPLVAQRVVLTFIEVAPEPVVKITPEVIARVAYTVAAQMVNIRGAVPVTPTPPPAPVEAALQQQTITAPFQTVQLG